MKEKNQIISIILSFFMKSKIKEIFNLMIITIFYILKLTLINIIKKRIIQVILKIGYKLFLLFIEIKNV